MSLSRSVSVEANGLQISFEGGFSNATARVIAAQEHFPEICEEELERAAERAEDIIVDVWRGISPVVTGEYVDSIHSMVTPWGSDRVDIEIWNDADHSEHVEFGTGNAGRGYIEGDNGRLALRFFGEDGSKWRRPYRVRGQRPQHVAERASRMAKPLMMAQFRLAANRAHARVRAEL